MTSTAVRVEFLLSSPIILRSRLYLDAVLLALATQSGVSFDEALANLPISQREGIFRCSQLLWDGLPEQMHAKIQMSIWSPRELDGYVQVVQKAYTKSDHDKNYKTLMDSYPALEIPQPYFLVETENVDRLLEAVEGIPALGKWSRKGYGCVAGVSIHETGEDPWVLPDGRPARALPVELWNRRYGGPHAFSMEVPSAPYWDTQRAQLCAVETIA